MFDNRIHAGQLLAEKVAALQLKNPYILAVPRGGIAVAAPIAKKLQAKLAVLVAKKIGHPLNPEVAIGAIMPDGSLIHDNQYICSIGVKQESFEQLTAQARQSFDEQVKIYEALLIKNHEIKGRDIVIADDGIATGYTICAAINWIKKWNPASLTIAVPVAPADITRRLRREQADVVCLDEREVFEAVGSYYKEFEEMSDTEALEYHRLAPNAIVRL